MERLAPYGLEILGELGPIDLAKTSSASGRYERIVLIGAAGSSIWAAFGDSDEYHDGQADPLDRWSRRIGAEIAEKLGATALYPFEMDPPLPFLRWAAAAGRSAPSRIGMFIHDDYGLWHAYRFALAFDSGSSVGAAAAPPLSQLCVDCSSQACLSACPVDAFTYGSEGSKFDVVACRDYLFADPQCDCIAAGCLARRACPVATEFVYEPDHARFHMEAFVGA